MLSWYLGLAYLSALLPVFYKLFEKLILKRFKLFTEKYKLVPSHHIELCNNQQVSRITDILEKMLERGQFRVLLDLDQVFD